VLAPEHPLIETLLVNGVITNKEEIVSYRAQAKQKLDIDRSAEGREKSGVRLEGVMAINPANNEQVPVFIADYVLPGYGTGAIMAVPAHDERDYQFAVKYGISTKEVIRPYVIDHVNTPRSDKATKIRTNVHAIVRDMKTGKFLILRNAIHKWDTVVIGGVEEGEDVIEAAKREVREETGYTDLVYKRTLGSPVQAGYFAPHKDENRLAIATAVYFELGSGTKIDIPTDGENEGNEVIWVDEQDFVPGKMINSELPFWLARLKSETPVLFTESGVLINSGGYNGMPSEEAKKKITEVLGGKIITKSKLRDWVFARQRYWGEPIPVVYDKDGKMYPVSEAELPIVLPDVEKYEPTDNGESPLYQVPEWVNVQGHINDQGYFISDPGGELFRRETDTMPQWAGSSWYFMRYIDPHNEKVIGDPALFKKWLPVNWYNGGMEHTTLHLLYSRFWYKFLYDIGIVPNSEPYKKRTSQGMILGAGGVKMSKSLGNVVNPTDIIATFGADVLRLYEMFIGPFDQAVAWDDKAIVGVARFLEKVQKVRGKVVDDAPSLPVIHQTIDKITKGIDEMTFNTCISQLMICINEFDRREKVSKEDYKRFVSLLAPFAPFIVEELWEAIGETGSVHTSPWSKADTNLLESTVTTIAFQVNGKLRDAFEIDLTFSQDQVMEIIKQRESYSKYVGDNQVKRLIYVPKKLINIVI
jgi:leucyl-tRNA synthetase family protein